MLQYFRVMRSCSHPGVTGQTRVVKYPNMKNIVGTRVLSSSTHLVQDIQWFLWSAKHDKSQSFRFPIAGPRFSLSIPRFACSSIRFQISSPRFPISSSRFPISSPRFPISSPRFPISSSRFPISSPRFPISSPRFPISSPRFPISSPRFSISRSSKRLCHRPYRFHSATSGYYSWILFSEILIVTTW